MNGDKFDLSGVRNNLAGALANLLGMSPASLNSRVSSAPFAQKAFTELGKLLFSSGYYFNRGR